MHAPYAAQYCVIGGSGAGRGGSFTPDAAAVSEAPLSAMVADAGVAAAVVALAAAFAAVVELAVFVAAAVAVLAVAVFAAGSLAPGAAAGIPVPGGAAEKLLGGKGGRDGAPVDDVLVTAGWRGGSCDSCAMLILVCLLAVA